MSSYSAASKFLKPRTKTDNMATAAYDNWVEPYLSPEVAPAPLQGAAWVLGKDYLLPQGTCPTKREFGEFVIILFLY